MDSWFEQLLLNTFVALIFPVADVVMRDAARLQIAARIQPVPVIHTKLTEANERKHSLMRTRGGIWQHVYRAMDKHGKQAWFFSKCVVYRAMKKCVAFQVVKMCVAYRAMN